MPSITKRAKFNPVVDKLIELLASDKTDAEVRTELVKELDKVVSKEANVKPKPFLLH